MPRIKLIGLDFDDTLASDVRHLHATARQVSGLLARHGATPEELALFTEETLFAAEKKALPITGFGVMNRLKAFQDLIIEHTPRLVTAPVMRGLAEIFETLRLRRAEIYDDVKDFMRAARDTLRIPAVIITKGQHYHQSDKIDALRETIGADLTPPAHIVGHKDAEAYSRILRAEGVKPAKFMMIGDSLSSDVAPVLEIGGHALHLQRLPEKGLSCAFETAAAPGARAFHRAENLHDALRIIQTLAPPPKPRPGPATT